MTRNYASLRAAHEPALRQHVLNVVVVRELPEMFPDPSREAPPGPHYLATSF